MTMQSTLATVHSICAKCRKRGLIKTPAPLPPPPLPPPLLWAAAMPLLAWLDLDAGLAASAPGVGLCCCCCGDADDAPEAAGEQAGVDGPEVPLWWQCMEGEWQEGEEEEEGGAGGQGGDDGLCLHPLDTSMHLSCHTPVMKQRSKPCTWEQGWVSGGALFSFGARIIAHASLTSLCGGTLLDVMSMHTLWSGPMFLLSSMGSMAL